MKNRKEKIMVRLEDLRSLMAESGMTMTAIAEKSGITRGTLYNKLDGKGEFKVSEIVSLCKTLRISDSKRNHIFFNA